MSQFLCRLKSDSPLATNSYGTRMIYQCPVCKVRTEIDKVKRTFQLLVDKPVFSFPAMTVSWHSRLTR